MKVTRAGRAERELKPELLADINDYRGHPTVDTLVVAIFDLAGTFEIPAGFEHNPLDGQAERLRRDVGGGPPEADQDAGRHDEGKRVASSTQTVAECLEYWLEEYARHRVRDTTFASHKWLITKYLVPLFGKKKLTALRPTYGAACSTSRCASAAPRARTRRVRSVRRPSGRSGKAGHLGRTPRPSWVLGAALSCRRFAAGRRSQMARCVTSTVCCGRFFKTLCLRTRS